MGIIIFIINELVALITGILGLLFLATIAVFNIAFTLLIDYPFISLIIIGIIIFYYYEKRKSQ